MLIAKFKNSDMEMKVINIEKKYGIVLPVQYKYFLGKYNGGYTPKTEFKIGKLSSDVRGFYGIGDVKLSLDKLEIDEWVKKNILPIGCDSFGNYFAIGFCKSEEINNNSTRSIKEREDALIAKGRGSIITDDLKKMWQAEIDKYAGIYQEEVVI